jgi:hypothetical protein
MECADPSGRGVRERRCLGDQGVSVGVMRILLVSVGLALILSACGQAVSDEGFPNGMIGVTDINGGCAYNTAEQGVVFRFTLTGTKNADMVAELHQAGQVVASKKLPVRHGNYTNPVTIVVPVSESRFKATRTRCVLQTDNLGRDILSSP